MTNTKARRVSIEEARYDRDPCLMAFDDPSGTHMLVPVEVWERVRQVLWEASSSVDLLSATRLLAEIGGEDE